MKKVIVIWSALGFVELQKGINLSFTDDDYKKLGVTWDDLRENARTKRELEEYLNKKKITVTEVINF